MLIIRIIIYYDDFFIKKIVFIFYLDATFKICIRLLKTRDRPSLTHNLFSP
jgi:hypothetical protein